MTTIDKVKEYWDSRPCNIRHSPKEIGTLEYFEEVSQRKYFVEPHIVTFANFDQWKGKRVLEIGCGIGTTTISFAKAGAHVTAIDLSPMSLEIAERRAKVYGLTDRIKFYCGNAEQLNQIIPIEEYDLIWSFGVVHHSVSPGRIIHQAKAYMGPNTLMRIMVYNRFSFKTFWIICKYGKFAFWNARDLVCKYSEAQECCPKTETYTGSSVKELLNGLKIRRKFVDHIFKYSIEPYKKYVYKTVWYFRLIPLPLFRALERVLGWHLCVEAELKK